MARSHRTYTLAQKNELITLVHQGAKIQDLAKKYGIPTGTIHTWAFPYGRRPRAQTPEPVAKPSPAKHEETLAEFRLRLLRFILEK